MCYDALRYYVGDIQFRDVFLETSNFGGIRGEVQARARYYCPEKEPTMIVRTNEILREPFRLIDPLLISGSP